MRRFTVIALTALLVASLAPNPAQASHSRVHYVNVNGTISVHDEDWGSGPEKGSMPFKGEAQLVGVGEQSDVNGSHCVDEVRGDVKVTVELLPSGSIKATVHLRLFEGGDCYGNFGGSDLTSISVPSGGTQPFEARTTNELEDDGDEVVVRGTVSNSLARQYASGPTPLAAAGPVGQQGWELFQIGPDGTINRMRYPLYRWERMEGTYAKAVAATTFGDGRVELFHIGADDAIYHAWQRTPGGPFGGWVRYSAIALDIAVAGPIGGGGWTLFHIGLDGAIYRMRSAGAWERLPGTYAKALAATASPDGRVAVFHIGSDDAIYRAYQRTPGGPLLSSSLTRPYGQWDRMDARARDIAAGPDGFGLGWEVFHTGSDGAIYRTSSFGGPSERMEGTFAYSLATTTFGDGRLELFHIGRGMGVYHAWQVSPGGPFSSWVLR